MKKLLGALLALIVVLVLFVVIVAATLPAATAYRYAEPRVQPLRLQGIDGSLWAGRATQASVYAVPLGELRWSLDPWAAVGLHARGEAALSGRALQASARFDATRDRLLVDTGNAKLPASVLTPALDIPSLVLLGDLDLDVDALELRAGMLQTATGTLTWRHAGVSGAAEARFSDIIVRFNSPRDGVIEGQVSDGGGALSATGRILIERERFNAEVKLGVRGDNPQLAEALLYVGERTPDGGSLLRVEGTLRKLF
ncbi:MAG TPA: type II secretion system protein N [Pseudomonadota bacterium]|jgi:general secretion pathway protein N|nr:type II secretion system protein N [Pseudomonadota bacterium]